MDADLQNRIEKTVIGILETADMEEMTESKVRKAASEKMGLDLSLLDRKQFVRQVVESFLIEHQRKAEKQHHQQPEEETAAADDEKEEEADEQENGSKRKEYDDEGDLIICRPSDKRRVTISEFKGRTLVSIREYYKKDGKELPSSKGISLTAEQWASFYTNIPAIEQAIDKMKSMMG